MKKKRFIKLLMAMGYSRNQAAQIAAIAEKKGVSHGAVFIGLVGVIFELRCEEDERLRRLVNANFGDEICATFVYE